jgi:hypothetical protein
MFEPDVVRIDRLVRDTEKPSLGKLTRVTHVTLSSNKDRGSKRKDAPNEGPALARRVLNALRA